MVDRSLYYKSSYSGTSLIRTPKIRAPPSNGQLLNSKLDQIRVGLWAWLVEMHDLLVSNQLYSEIRANLSYGHFLKPDCPDKGGSTVFIIAS